MGDGGLSVGAAALHHSKLSKVRIKKLNNIYLGKSFKKNDILKEIKKFNLKIIKNKNLNNFVASEINNGKVVAIFNGKMEFGPRSLGNRSILCRATDPKINKSLNKKLKRTEFMPFAPITLKNHAQKCILILLKDRFLQNL